MSLEKRNECRNGCGAYNLPEPICPYCLKQILIANGIRSKTAIKVVKILEEEEKQN